MRAPQSLHLPRNSRYESTGTLSYQRTRAPHETQWEGGIAMLMPRGSR